MCVIIAKPYGAKTPDIRIIRAAMDANPDGFAIAWSNRGKLEIYRTLNRKDMENYYIDNFSELEKTSFVFHARIATHGTKILSNCHGWTCLKGKYAFFHNGMLSITARDNMTDSETFLRDIYEPIASKYGHKGAEPAIHAVIGTSKFAFINGRGAIKMYGTWTERNGVYYSNTHFMYDYNSGRISRRAYPFEFPSRFSCDPFLKG